MFLFVLICWIDIRPGRKETAPNPRRHNLRNALLLEFNLTELDSFITIEATLKL